MTTIPLSARESTILRFCAWGYSHLAIGRLLGISAKTVEAHKASGMRKLALLDRAALVRHAVWEGWLIPSAIPEFVEPGMTKAG